MPPSAGAIVAAEQLADRIALLIKASLAPMQAQVAALEQRCKTYETQLADLGVLRERVAVTEARSPLAGPPGPPGSDGFTPDELTATQDPADERLVTLAYRRGDQVKTIGTLRLSTPRYCGIYDETKGYTTGDEVTYKGSQWHCHTATSARPGEGASGWTLQVKCGRDGRDARP
jgi:hypothetical protein